MLALLLFSPHAARAAPAPALSPYERATIEAAVLAQGAEVDPAPEGKIFEGIEVATLPVFEERDPLPAFAVPLANWFHVTSRRSIIEQEVLLSEGDRYEQALVDQTARNLRAFPQLSLVLLVPLRGSAPDRVRLLVITKDVWSLRLNSSWVFENGRLLQLVLQPSEENLAGTHQQLLGNFVLDPATYAVGGQYLIHRLGHSRVAANAGLNVIVNRDSGQAEGQSGAVSLGQPLYSIRARWAWSASFSWDREIARRFVGGFASDFDPASGRCVAISASPGGGQDDPSRCRYRRSVTAGGGALTRSFGPSDKADVTLGFSATRARYTPFDLSALPNATQVALLQALLPVSDSQVAPSAALHLYSSRYLDLLDLDTLGLTENVQRGHDLTLRVTPVTRALGSTRDFVDLLAAATYTLPLGDGLARASISSDTELARGDLPDASLDLSARLVSPRFCLGRLLLDARLLDRYRDYLNLRSALGGDGRLRGYPAGSFVGKDFFVANLEYRTAPLELFAVQLGGALFADAGDAFDSFAQAHLKESAGGGLRILFPQLQRYVMRIDLGVPLSRGPWPSRPDLVVTFGQAIPAIGN